MKLTRKELRSLINETIELPISFIIGTSFISGSILGGLISFNSFKKYFNNKLERVTYIYLIIGACDEKKKKKRGIVI